MARKTTMKKPAKPKPDGGEKARKAVIASIDARLKASGTEPKAAPASAQPGHKGARPGRKAKPGARSAHGPTSAPRNHPRIAPKAPAPKAKAPAGPKRLSALDAAAKVLSGAPKPMSCKDLIATMSARGLWKSPGGKTPEATLSAAMRREITVKGSGGRFKKDGRGLFVALLAPAPRKGA